MKTLLARRVPHLKTGYAAIRQLELFLKKVCADCGLVVLAKLLVVEHIKQGSLPDTLVSKNKDF